MHRIEAALVVPGRGDPVRDAVVRLDGPVIGYAGPAAGAPADITVLADPARVSGVWRSGRRVKG